MGHDQHPCQRLDLHGLCEDVFFSERLRQQRDRSQCFSAHHPRTIRQYGQPPTIAVLHNTKGVISARSLNVRDEASASGKIVGSYFKGDVVTILETKDGWGRTDKGWIKMEYVNTTGTTTGGNTTTTTTGNNNNTAGNGSTTTVAKGIVNTQELNIRSLCRY